jgi:hypothetical protein
VELEDIPSFPGENNNSGSMIKQFLDVTLLNAGEMISTRLPPVPFSRAAGKKLRVLIGRLSVGRETSLSVRAGVASGVIDEPVARQLGDALECSRFFE